MFNPSFCQETVMRVGGRGRAVFPWGTNELLVGDKRGPRGGQTRPSSGTNGNAVGDCCATRCRSAVCTRARLRKARRHKCQDFMIFWKRVQQAINDLWYLRSVTVGKPVETQELANRIARESTVSPADTHAVLRALPAIMADFMKESRAIHLEGLGWFRYTTVSAGNGVATKDEVSSDQITGLRVQFTPDRTRNMSGGYTRALIADEGVSFMEWLGKPDDETQIPDDEDGDEGVTENPLG